MPPLPTQHYPRFQFVLVHSAPLLVAFPSSLPLPAICPIAPHVPRYEIIDGQQRLTTLQILLLAFRSFLKSIRYADEDLNYDLGQLTINGGSRGEEIEKYKVWPTIADRATYEILASSTSLEDLNLKTSGKRVGSPLLVEAYRFFYNNIDEYVRFGETDEEIVFLA